MSVSFKQCSIEDYEQIISLGSKTFFETFAETNTEADMKEYLETNFNIDQVKKELSNPLSTFYIAYYDDKPAAYMKLNQDGAQTGTNYPHSLEVQRIYVLKEFKRKGIGAVLMQNAIDLAKTLKVDYIWLGVWEHNPSAIAFYKKLGFIQFDSHTFQLGSDPQTDIILKLVLK